MADFPTIQLPSGLSERPEDNTIRTEFETGIIQTRGRYTRIRRAWELNWDDIGDADYRALFNFYVDRKGGALEFNWIHPLEQNTYNVRFKEPPDFQVLSYNYWRGSITLEEV